MKSIISPEANTGWKGHCSKRSTKFQESSQGPEDFPGTNKTAKTDAYVFLRKKRKDKSDVNLGRQTSKTTIKQ